MCVGGGGGGVNRFHMATAIIISSVVYTRRLFSPREGFLTHQCVGGGGGEGKSISHGHSPDH